MSKIFISYRRDDTQHQADRLYEQLIDTFEKSHVFMDIDNIPLGVDFAYYLDQQVGQCEVLLALMGRHWLSEMQRRAVDPADFVRIEIASALNRNIPVIPVLFDDAPMPRAEDLPLEIRALVRRNGTQIRRIGFRNDVSRLIDGLLALNANAPSIPGAAGALREATPSDRVSKADEYGAPIEVPAASIGTEPFEPNVAKEPPLTEAADNHPADHQPDDSIDDPTDFSPAETLVTPGSPDTGMPVPPPRWTQIALSAALLIAVSGLGWIAYQAGGGGKTVPVQEPTIEVSTPEQVPETVPEPEAVQTDTAEDPAATLTPSPPPEFTVGKVFQDTLRGGGKGPEMVVVPAGRFERGAPASEAGRQKDEGPVREVTISKAFAVGKFEVTWAEWEACVAGGGCSAARSDGFGGGSRPVTNVDWNDAQAYVSWLSSETGARYRLLTEAEWEYAARAGTTSAYWWGNSASHEYANYGKDTCCGGLASGRDEWVNTSRAGAFPPNGFGLYDMHGNVWEWVEDCYQDSYSGLPVDGTANTTQGCSYRVSRGGSWSGIPGSLRSAFRDRNVPAFRNYVLGFRVARTL